MLLLILPLYVDRCIISGVFPSLFERAGMNSMNCAKSPRVSLFKIQGLITRAKHVAMDICLFVLYAFVCSCRLTTVNEAP